MGHVYHTNPYLFVLAGDAIVKPVDEGDAGWGSTQRLPFSVGGRDGFAYPFEAHSTCNYRGHVATLKIEDGEFHLSELRADAYISEPNEWDVASKTRPASEDGDVWAGHLNWPYNWENLDKCGAPHCRWVMEDDRLYVAGIELYSRLSYYSIDTEELDLTTLFGDRVVDGVVDANWVSGVYLIKHGYATEEDAGWPGYTFTVFHVTGYTYVRMAQGRLMESYTVPEDFNSCDLPDDADPGLLQIIEDYQLPSVFDTPSDSTQAVAVSHQRRGADTPPMGWPNSISSM